MFICLFEDFNICVNPCNNFFTRRSFSIEKKASAVDIAHYVTGITPIHKILVDIFNRMNNKAWPDQIHRGTPSVDASCPGMGTHYKQPWTYIGRHQSKMSSSKKIDL